MAFDVQRELAEQEKERALEEKAEWRQRLSALFDWTLQRFHHRHGV